ncbi:XVIPCD domain-containing protein [uncultured Xanthomonas sp.]|uniref:XVIPCD domain-containing protein n=1 Tax=uncultured Xanthomonas sp. TaxID=152831 RepID=UPI0025D2DD3E|nr:XVIPCD domain-containing protein [uncultured Xanthomonas sp.]
MSTLTDKELRATLYFAVGVTSESRYDAYRLVVAGDKASTPTLEPADSSGYSIGTIQTDLGQHYQPNDPNGENVPRDLINAYQDWARAHQPQSVLTDDQATRAIADLGRDGDAIRNDHGRPLDADVKSRLDTFLASDAGITWVHDRDVAQIDKLMDRAIAPLQRSNLYQNASLDDQVKLAAMVGKAYNQNEVRAATMIRKLEGNQYDSVADVSAAIDGFLPKRSGQKDYFELGRDDALRGAAVVNLLRNANRESPLSTAWASVLADPLVNPTALNADRAHQNLPHEYPVIKNLFIHDDRAGQFVGALDRGGAHQYGPTDRAHPERFNGPGFYAAGNDLVNWNKHGQGHAFLNGEWSSVTRENLTRARNHDGTTDLNLQQGGQTQRLLHVDPHASELRPAPQQHGGRTGPDNPAHPDHAMLLQIRDGVQRLGSQAGVPFDENSERVCRSLLAACKDNGDQYPNVSSASLSGNALTRVDHVVAGPERLIAVQGELNDPAHLRAHVPVQQAMQTPVEQSDAKLMAANQVIAQEQAMTQQREVSRSQGQSLG